jgi:hypothetical protein
MPFTVVTQANLKISSNAQSVDRSLNGSNSTGALVGSHMNRLNNRDTHANYWFSRLLEHFGVKICIGGHKHTYACTNPLREYYYYVDGGVTKNSLDDGPMTMESTLANDSATFTTKATVDGGEVDIHTTKFPLMQTNEDNLGITKATNVYYPVNGVSELTNGVVYFMLQATGYKLKSNKELPSPFQTFSYVIPKTDTTGSSDSPSGNQQRPMFAKIHLDSSNYKIYLCRIENILTANFKFDQLSHGTAASSYQFLEGNVDGGEGVLYGKWDPEQKALITINS